MTTQSAGLSTSDAGIDNLTGNETGANNLTGNVADANNSAGNVTGADNLTGNVADTNNSARADENLIGGSSSRGNLISDSGSGFNAAGNFSTAPRGNDTSDIRPNFGAAGNNSSVIRGMPTTTTGVTTATDTPVRSRDPIERIEEELLSLRERLAELVSEATECAHANRLVELRTAHLAIAKTRETFNELAATRETLMQGLAQVTGTLEGSTTSRLVQFTTQPSTSTSLLHVADLHSGAPAATETRGDNRNVGRNLQEQASTLGSTRRSEWTGDERPPRIPPNLPKFREQGYEKAEVFISELTYLCRAWHIPDTRIITILPLCLAPEDRMWFMGEYEADSVTPWGEVTKKFLKHFSDPNLASKQTKELYSLTVSSMGGNLQRFTDRFLYLCSILKLELDSESMLKQYREGLPQWIQKALSSTQAHYLFMREVEEASGKESPRLTVTMLGKMAQAIEANRVTTSPDVDKSYRRQDTTPFTKRKNTSTFQGTCHNCDRVGHKANECERPPRTSGMKRQGGELANQRDYKRPNTSEGQQRHFENKMPHNGTPIPIRSGPSSFSNNRYCNHCRKPGHTDELCWFKNKSKMPVVKHINNNAEKYVFVKAPCEIEGKRVMALVDSGASRSLISLKLVEELGLVVVPKTGQLKQVTAGSEVPRIGIVRNVNLRCGRKKIDAMLEVVNLDDYDLVVGGDRMYDLGIHMVGVPLMWPDEIITPSDGKSGKPQISTDEDETLPPGIPPSRIAPEWEQVLADNKALPVNSRCLLENAELEIDTGDAKPVWIRPRPIPQAYHESVDKVIEQWKAAGTVVPSPEGCQWNLAILAVPKFDKQGRPNGVRVCLDARPLNKLIRTSPDNSMPSIPEILQLLNGFDWISLFDLSESYLQFALKYSDQLKTSFTWKGVQYMFTGVPFGLRSMSAHLQNVMERLLKKKNLHPYQDDVSVPTKPGGDHVQDVLKFLKVITYEAGLRLKLEKCEFFKKKAIVLGHLLSTRGIMMDPVKVEAIVNWPKPDTGKAMQRFLGTAGYYREFSHEYAKIAAPLESCRNDRVIEWDQEKEKAFEDLKGLFTKNLLLRHINWSKDLYLVTDASLVGAGAWLGQKDEMDGELYPVMCISKKFQPSQRKWSATQRELYALMWAMKRFRYYLLGRHFIAIVDHKPLVAMLENPLTHVTERWLDVLLQFDFTTVYKPGDTNNLADALSRMYESEEMIQIRTLDIDEPRLDSFMVPEEDKRHELITKTHLMGHFGVKMCAKMINTQGFNWPEMETEIAKEIMGCIPCQRYNVVQKGYNPLMSIVAEYPWDHVQIDLVGPLPKSEEGHEYFLTYVDLMSALTLLRPLKTKDMQAVTEVLWQIFAEYGPPKIVQADNGSEFVNKLLSQLLQTLGIEQRLITAYHPRANGLVERTNGVASHLLKKIMMSDHGHWQKYLPAVQMAMNLRVQERTGSSPFTVAHGRPFNGFEDFSAINTAEDLEELIGRHTERQKLVREIVYPALVERTKGYKGAQERTFRNRHKIVKPFEKGDTVWAQDATRGSKWDPVYQGPYIITQVHNKGRSYTVKDMVGEELKTRFNTHMLKKGSSDVLHPGGGKKETNGDKTQKKPKIKSTTPEGSTKEPQETGGYFRVNNIVDHRERNGMLEYLVNWHGYGHKENTWEAVSQFVDMKAIKDYWEKRRKVTIQEVANKEPMKATNDEVILPSKPVTATSDERRSTRPPKRKAYD